VFAGAQMREERYVAIGGAVRPSRPVPLSDGHDAARPGAARRGRKRERARQAEIARLPEPGSDRSVTARTFRVPVTTKDVPMSGAPRPGGAQGRDGPVPTADAEIVLQPHDNVLILRRPDWAMPRTVMLVRRGPVPLAATR
jgi:hypothetical protein